MHRDRAHALCRELVVLVFHEGNERTDHYGESGQQQSGQLIDEGFPAPRRHHDKGILPGENGLERRPLTKPEILMPKAIAEQLAGRLPRYPFRHTGLHRHKVFRRST